MPLIKLNRINKAGEIILNSEEILYMEIESRTTTIHMVGGGVFSVMESPQGVIDAAELMHVERLKKAIVDPASRLPSGE
ncbi:MAG: hypothetical protein WCR20_04380 [Verrucomicrobiota bacterium]